LEQPIKEVTSVQKKTTATTTTIIVAKNTKYKLILTVINMSKTRYKNCENG